MLQICLYKVHKRGEGGVIYTKGLMVFLNNFLLKNRWLPVLSPPTFLKIIVIMNMNFIICNEVIFILKKVHK